MSLRSRPLNKVVQSFKRAASVEKWEGVGGPDIMKLHGINTWQRSGCGKCGLPFKKFDKEWQLEVFSSEKAHSVFVDKMQKCCLLERKGIHGRVNVQVGSS